MNGGKNGGIRPGRGQHEVVTAPRTSVVQRGAGQSFLGRAGPRAFAIATVVTLLIVLLINAAGPLLDALDHWTADLRTSFFTYQLPGQHKRVAFVVINEESIAEAQKDSAAKYRSPIDRGLLARVVERLDGLGAKAIGVDVLIDQSSEPDKDRAFLAAVRKAKSDVVLARLDFAEDRAQIEPQQREYHDRFLAEAGRASGYVTARTEIDGIVRNQAVGGTAEFPTFAEQLARSAGWTPRDASGPLTEPSERIAWLRPPANNATTFLTLPATLLIMPPADLIAIEAQLLQQLADRVVIIGVRFNDRTDRHRTPLNRSETDLIAGPEIHAHIAAQLIDGRSYHELLPHVQLALCYFLAFIGALANWHSRDSDLLVGILPLLVYIGVGAGLFWTHKLILPFAAPMLAWLAGVYIARLVGSPASGPRAIETT